MRSGRIIYSCSDGVITAEIYYAHIKYDRKIGTRASLLVYTSHDSYLQRCRVGTASLLDE